MGGLFKIKPSSKTHARYFSPISLPLHLYGREFYILFYTKKQPGYMYIFTRDTLINQPASGISLFLVCFWQKSLLLLIYAIRYSC